MNWQRLFLGLIAIGFLLVGSGAYFLRPEATANWNGVAIRVGTILAVIWLAMPDLKTMQTKISTIVFLIALLLLVVAATKPNIFKVVAGITAIGLAANWVLKWASNLTAPPKS